MTHRWLALLMLLVPLGALAQQPPPGVPNPRAAPPPVTMTWNYGTDPEGFIVGRCAVPSGQTTCVPTEPLAGMPLPGTARRYTDEALPTSGTYCWSVVATAQGQRSPPATEACSTPTGTLPPAGTITLTPQGTGLRLTWSAPAFNAPATVPPSALTEYNVWRRTNVGVGDSWAIIATTPPDVTRYDDQTVVVESCYQIRANYGALGYIDNDTVCGAPQPPVVDLPAPTNLRIAP